jgi:hypothetical protein
MATNQALVEAIYAILKGTDAVVLPAYNPRLGIKVDRALDAFVITGSPGDPYFTVAGGMVVITSLVGYVTTTFGGVVNTLSFEFNPDAGGGANVVFCTPTDVGTTGVVGDIITMDGLPGSALVCGHRGTNPTFLRPVIVAPGVIGCVITAAVGAARWVLHYFPIDVGATVVAIP